MAFAQIEIKKYKQMNISDIIRINAIYYSMNRKNRFLSFSL